MAIIILKLLSAKYDIIHWRSGIH